MNNSKKRSKWLLWAAVVLAVVFVLSNTKIEVVEVEGDAEESTSTSSYTSTTTSAPAVVETSTESVSTSTSEPVVIEEETEEDKLLELIQIAEDSNAFASGYGSDWTSMEWSERNELVNDVLEAWEAQGYIVAEDDIWFMSMLDVRYDDGNISENISYALAMAGLANGTVR